MYARLWYMYVALLARYLVAIIPHISLPPARDRRPDELGIRMGKALSQWLCEASRFLCFATEKNPFPWKPWTPVD